MTEIDNPGIESRKQLLGRAISTCEYTCASFGLLDIIECRRYETYCWGSPLSILCMCQWTTVMSISGHDTTGQEVETITKISWPVKNLVKGSVDVLGEYSSNS